MEERGQPAIALGDEAGGRVGDGRDPAGIAPLARAGQRGAGDRVQGAADLALEQRIGAGADVRDVHPRGSLSVADHQYGQVRQGGHYGIEGSARDSGRLDDPAQGATTLLEELQAVGGKVRLWFHVTSIARLAQPHRLAIPRQACGLAA